MSERYFLGSSYYLVCRECRSTNVASAAMGIDSEIDICQACGEVEATEEVTAEEHEALLWSE